MFHCSIASCKGNNPVFAIDACCLYSCIPPNRHLLHRVVALQLSGSGNPGIEEVSTEVPHMRERGVDALLLGVVFVSR